MKARLLVALLFVGGFAFGQGSVELRWASGQDGVSIDLKTIDVASYSDGDVITLGVYVDDLDFVLAGFEAELQFLDPTLIMESTNDAFQDGTPPLRKGDAWGGAELVMLPSNSLGQQTATTVVNSFGTFRFGGLPVDPEARLDGDGATDYCIAEIDLIVNKPTADCATASSIVRLKVCSGSGGNDCDIFADASANRVTMNATLAGRSLTVVNSSATVTKGDLGGNGTADTSDILDAILCANGLEPCPLTGDPDANMRGDVNCSGGVINTGDILPLINLANQVTGRSVGKNITMSSVKGVGSLVIDNAGVEGALFDVEIAVEGNVTFKPVSLTENGWLLNARYHADMGVYKVIGAYLGAKNVSLPSLEIEYVAGDAAMGVLKKEFRNAGNQVIQTVGEVVFPNAPRNQRPDTDRRQQ